MLAMALIPFAAALRKSCQMARSGDLRDKDGDLSMKLKPSLTLDVVSAILDSALAYGRAENLLPLTVVMLDAGGKMIVSKSEDGSGIMRFDLSLIHI